MYLLPFAHQFHPEIQKWMELDSLNPSFTKEASFWGQPAYLLYPFYDVNDRNTSTNGYVFDNVTINKEKMD